MDNLKIIPSRVRHSIMENSIRQSTSLSCVLAYVHIRSIKNAAGNLCTTSNKLDKNLNAILDRLEDIGQSQKEMVSQLNNRVQDISTKDFAKNTLN